MVHTQHRMGEMGVVLMCFVATFSFLSAHVCVQSRWGGVCGDMRSGFVCFVVVVVVAATGCLGKGVVVLLCCRWRAAAVLSGSLCGSAAADVADDDDRVAISFTLSFPAGQIRSV